MNWAWRILTLVATLLAVWSPAHYLAQSAYEFNSWKFWGFAMYSEPYPLEHIAVRVVQDGMAVDVTHELDSYPCYRESSLDELAAYGMLGEPGPLLRCVLEKNAFASSGNVTVGLQQYNRKTQRFREMQLSWHLSRANVAAPPDYQHRLLQEWMGAESSN